MINAQQEWEKLPEALRQCLMPPRDGYSARVRPDCFDKLCAILRLMGVCAEWGIRAGGYSMLHWSFTVDGTMLLYAYSEQPDVTYFDMAAWRRVIND